MKSNTSVIIPNYNYGRFLERRINSILKQSIQPEEIIFLDNCSTDNSVEIAKKILNETSIPYEIVVNKENLGIFRQWFKGIKMAHYKYIWVADADDYCEYNFLEEVLPAFDDQDIILSYAQSLRTESENIQMSWANWLSSIFDNTSKWTRSYTNNCEDELLNYEAIAPCIANPSAVVLNKKFINLNLYNEIIEYRMAGDWLFYILLLSHNRDKKISYNANILNYWYQHNDSIWGSCKCEMIAHTECLRILSKCLHEFDIPLKSRMIMFKWISKQFLTSKGDDVYYKHKLIEVLMLLGDDTYLEQISCLVSKIRDLK